MSQTKKLDTAPQGNMLHTITGDNARTWTCGRRPTRYATRILKGFSHPNPAKFAYLNHLRLCPNCFAA